MNTKTQNVNNPSDLLGGFGADRKKMIIAATLILLMIFMWVRVIFSGKVGSDASAAGIDNQALEHTQQQSAGKIMIDYIELDVVAGRNDKLSRNFFDADSFSAFPLDPDGGFVPKTGLRDNGSLQDQGRIIDQIAQTMKIDAIIVGNKPGIGEVFIAERLLANGSTFEVDHKGRIYEFEVMEVFESKVVLKWKNVTVTIEMSKDE